jgi:hypothetical protein
MVSDNADVPYKRVVTGLIVTGQPGCFCVRGGAGSG